MLNKLTAILIRRDPQRSLQASVFFTAHELIREQIADVEDDCGPVSDEQVNGAGEDLADHMLDLALCAGDDAHRFLAQEVERSKPRA